MGNHPICWLMVLMAALVAGCTIGWAIGSFAAHLHNSWRRPERHARLRGSIDRLNAFRYRLSRVEERIETGGSLR